jgi:hypothetical protein
MKILHVVVSSLGFRDPNSNPVRWKLLEDLLRLAAELGVHLLVLPGGFLTARDCDEEIAFIERAKKLADAAGVGIIGGIDLVDLTPTRKKGDGSQCGFPYFAFAVGPVALLHPRRHPWQQTSTDNENAGLVPDAKVPGAERLVVVDGVLVAVVICGELFSERARDSITRLGASLVVDLGHSGMGQGLIPAMKRLARDGRCAVAHAQHLASIWGGLHFVDAAGVQQSVSAKTNELVRHEGLWAGGALRTV